MRRERSRIYASILVKPLSRAMAHACLPVVYARGGIFDVLNVDDGGVPYMTYEGLVEGLVEIASLWGSPEVGEIQRKMITGALECPF